MHTNDPGREPTEPTDAELLRDFEAADVRLSNACENCMDFSEEGEPTDPEYLDAEYEWKLCNERREARGREYLSGARTMPQVSSAGRDPLDGLRVNAPPVWKLPPMPQTPAPDEVAQLPEHFCTYPDCRCKPDELDGWCAKGLPTPISLWRQNTALTARIADLEREVADRNSDYINDSATLAEISAENTAIRAKCSDLERENAALGAELSNIVNAKRFDRKVFDDDSGFADWAQSRARFTLAAVSAGKEAPDA